MRIYLRNYISSIVDVDARILDEFISLFKEEKIQKRNYFLHEGSSSEKIAFVEEGILRGYYVNRNGEEITTFFFDSPTFTMDYNSYKRGIPTTMNIQALTDVTVLISNIEDIYRIADKHMIINKVYRIVLEDLYSYAQDRKASFIVDTAIERYERFLSKRIHILQQVPLRHIASYLGIKPETLSRIRKKIVTNDFS